MAGPYNKRGFDQARYDQSPDVYDQIDADFDGHRYQIGEELIQHFLHRYAIESELVAHFLHRYGQVDLVAHFLHRYAIEIELVKHFLHRYQTDPEVINTGPGGIGHLPPNTEVSAFVPAWQCNVGTLTPVLNVTGAPAQLKQPQNANFTLRTSGPSEFSLEFRVSTRSGGITNVHPDKVGGAWEGILDTNPYVAGVLTKKLTANITFGGGQFLFTGVGLSKESTQRARGLIDFRWSGADTWHQRMGVEDQTLPTVRSTRGSQVTMKQVVAEICNTYETEFDLDAIEDYQVPVMHRQKGRPIEWVADLFETIMAEYRIEDEKMVAFIPGQASQTWNYSSTYCLREESVSTSLGRIFNSVRVVRTEEVGKRAAPGKDVFTFQRYTCTFDEPLYSFRFKELERAQGIFEDFICRDEDGVIVAILRPSPDKNYPLNLIAAGAVHGVKSVDFLWRAASIDVQNQGITGSHGRIEFQGNFGRRVDALNPQAVDTDFVATAVWQPSIDVHGVKFVEFEASPLIPNVQTAQLFADRFVEFVGRPRETHTFLAPFNPRLMVGDRVVYNHTGLGKTYDLTVQLVQHNVADDSRDNVFTRFVAYELLLPET